MLEALDGPSIQGKITVTDAAVSEAKVGVSSFDDRKVLTLEGNGRFYVYFANEGEVPSAATVADQGFLHYRNTKETYEASETQIVFLLAVTGSVDIKIAERA
jgi:hypothetical protein